MELTKEYHYLIRYHAVVKDLKKIFTPLLQAVIIISQYQQETATKKQNKYIQTNKHITFKADIIITVELQEDMEPHIHPNFHHQELLTIEIKNRDRPLRSLLDPEHFKGMHIVELMPIIFPIAFSNC